ncbi:DUF6624 domain-containing protein [Streptomyces niveus]|uniref:DUF6624 domain-containing protein n=1 Tax=Streptomyces niveus TaxID=193462 RepID=UPI0036AD6D06
MNTGPRRPDIARELIDRAAKAREHWDRLARTQLSAELAGMGRHADYANACVLKRIVADHGWPDVALVGEDGARAAWQIALHTDADMQRDVQQLFCRALHEAAQRGTASIQQWAHLNDRCLLNNGHLQLYGTQYRLGPEGPERQPVLDPATLDERRAELGLPPAANSLRRVRARLSGEPRADDGGPGGELPDAA